jgi:rhodanese-related sulfurtransferase
MQAIERENLQKMMDRGDGFVLLDVLPRDTFDSGHLPGATNVPYGDASFEERVRRHAPDESQPIVVYGRDADDSERAAEALDALGYHVVYAYNGGITDWRQAALPLASAG